MFESPDVAGRRTTQLTSPPQEAPLGETVVPDGRLVGAGGLRPAGILVEVVKTRS